MRDPIWRSVSGPITDRIALTTKAPYLPPADVVEYERPPAGFHAIATRVVCRHGSRTPAKVALGAGVISLWQSAEDRAALTASGQGVAGALREFVEECARAGDGALTEAGRIEMAGIASRLARRLPHMLRRTAAAENQAELEVVSASKQRTQDSAAVFVAHLDRAVPGLASRVSGIRIDDDLLYFHKSNERYQAYARSDPRLLTVRSAVRDQSGTRSAARELLTNIFVPAFVDHLAAGRGNGIFANELDAATAVFSLWQMAAGSSRVDRGLAQLVSPAAAEWFGYLDDLDTFFAKGPGFAGDDITYSMAKDLLADLFAYFEARRTGQTAYVARLCFTHAEEILPLASLLRLPGSDRQVEEGDTFRYATNDFRGAEIAPMAANIQWDLYSNGNDQLIRMLHNERQTPFAAGCAPIAPDSFFYQLTDVMRFYGWRPPAS